MPTDPNMTGLIYPTEGDSVDIWAMIMNSTCWPIIGAHDHTTGQGSKIPSAALKINADVSWAFSGTSYAVTDAKAIDFAAQTAASVASYAGALFVNSSDANNLYFRTVGGTNVKITDGTTLNVSIVGGIGGDYSSVGALLDYDDATDTYRFRQETAAAVRQFAKIKSADLLLGEYKASGDPTPPTNFVTLKSPAALAAGYSVTFLGALPASDVLLSINNAGQLSAPATRTRTRTYVRPPLIAREYAAAPAHAWPGTGADFQWKLGNSTNALIFEIDVAAGDILNTVSVHADKLSDATNTLQLRVYKVDQAGGAVQIGSASNSAAAPGSITLTTAALAETIATGFSYVGYFNQTDATPSGIDSLWEMEFNVTELVM